MSRPVIDLDRGFSGLYTFKLIIIELKFKILNLKFTKQTVDTSVCVWTEFLDHFEI